MSRFVNNKEPCFRPDSLSNREAFARGTVGRRLAHPAAFLITMRDSVLAFMTKRLRKGRQTGEREKLTWGFNLNNDHAERTTSGVSAHLYLNNLDKKLVREAAVHEEIQNSGCLTQLYASPCSETLTPHCSFTLFTYTPNF